MPDHIFRVSVLVVAKSAAEALRNVRHGTVEGVSVSEASKDNLMETVERPPAKSRPKRQLGLIPSPPSQAPKSR